MRITVKVEGLREIRDALSELPKATGKNIARRILRERAKPFLDSAKSKVPTDRGTLKRSMIISSKLTKRQRRKHKKPDPRDIEIYIGPGSLPHAHLIEFGWSHSGSQPYLTPAWEANKGSLLKNIGGDFWVEIEKAFARIARKASRRI